MLVENEDLSAKFKAAGMSASQATELCAAFDAALGERVAELDARLENWTRMAAQFRRLEEFEGIDGVQPYRVH
ncbi:MAG: hypothetical protein ACXW3V_06155 [Methylocystis sp.]